MNTESDIQYIKRHQKVVRGILKRIGATAFGLVLFTTICILAAGRLNWIWPLVYLGINIVYASIFGPILIRTNPEASAERGEFKATNK